MSWMDWGSKPKKSSATPPPFYLTAGGEDTPYCHTCGRVIGTRHKVPVKDKEGKGTTSKFCSAKCRTHKPSSAPDSIDRRIEDTILALLNGEDPPRSTEDETADTDNPKMSNTKPAEITSSAKKQPLKKGDHRILVQCTQVEEIIYNRTKDPEKVYGRRKNRLPRWMPEKDPEWRSVDMVSTDEASSDSGSDEAVSQSQKNHSSPGAETLSLSDHDREPRRSATTSAVAVPESDSSIVHDSSVSEDLEKRRQGERRAQERERVRCAARRAVIFGLVTGMQDVPIRSEGKNKKSKKGRRRGSISSDDEEEGEGQGPREVRRKCEAVMNGVVVEPSFAKGDWGVRWREE